MLRLCSRNRNVVIVQGGSVEDSVLEMSSQRRCISESMEGQKGPAYGGHKRR